MKAQEVRTHKVVRSRAADQSNLIETFSKLQMLQSELASTQLILDVLSQFTILMSKNLDFEHFCQAVAHILKERLKFTYIHIWVFNGQDELTLVTPEKKESKRTISITKGIIGKTIRTQQLTYVEDVKSDPDYINVHKDASAELCIPLILEGEVLGVMNIEAKKNEALKEYIPLLQVIAENLSYNMRVAFLHGVEDQFKKLLDQMSEGLCVIDSDDNISYVNPALLTMTGYDLKDVTGRKYSEFIISQQLAKADVKIKNKKVFNAVLKCKNNITIPVILTSNRDQEGTNVVTITDLRTITLTKKKLQETELFLATLTKNAHEAIIALDEKEKIVDWNVGAHRLFGHKTGSVTGKKLDFILHSDSPSHLTIANIIEEARTKHYVKNIELICSHKSGVPIEASLTASALFNIEGKIMGYAIFLRDISAQKKWEREIQDRFEKVQEAYKEMGKQRRYLDYLEELIEYALTPGTTRQNIATYLVSAFIMVSKANAATIRLYDKETDKLMLSSFSGLGEEWLSKKYVPYTGSLIESAVKQGTPLKIFDVVSSNQYFSPALARKNDLRSALIVPFVFQGEVLGSLTLYVSHEGNLNLLDDEFISTFSKQASLALKLAN